MAVKSFLGRADLPRGLRNNNPGNVALTAIKWKGKIHNDKNTDKGNPRLEQFTDIHFGIRAMGMDLHNDHTRDGKNTIKKIMYEYCPPPDDTEAYIKTIVKATGIAADTPFTLSGDVLRLIMKTIVRVEVGAKFAYLVTDEDIEIGISLMPKSMQ